MKSAKDYSSKTKYLSETTAEEASAAVGGVMGLEFFSLCRSTMMDVQAEYENYDQLKRMRQAYIVHILDVLLKERSIVAKNDRELKEEEDQDQVMMHGERVTLENVFELAKKGENGGEGS